jgi:hypothetical protein
MHCRNFSNITILFTSGSFAGHHFFFWWHLFGHDPVAGAGNDLSSVRFDLSIRTILTHCSAITARHTGNWLCTTNTFGRKIYGWLDRRAKESTSARVKQQTNTTKRKRWVLLPLGIIVDFENSMVLGYIS